MMLRVAAIVSIVLGTTILMLYLDLLGKTPWASPAERDLRAMKDRTTTPASFTQATFRELVELPRRAPLVRYAPLERRAVSLEGYVQRTLRAPDGDYHLDFADTLDADGHLVPFLSAEVTPQWHLQSERWGYERLVALFRPYVGGETRWDAPPRRVRLSGWLMYDVEAEGEPVVFGFPPRTTAWEIHPVTRIETWDDSLRRFVEHPL
jgi:hypothetical protein